MFEAVAHGLSVWWKQMTLALGQYPQISLRDARRARDTAKDLLAKEINPSAHRKAERRKRSIAAANTFEAVANEWFEANRVRWDRHAP
jgi:hypothetical protein